MAPLKTIMTKITLSKMELEVYTSMQKTHRLYNEVFQAHVALLEHITESLDQFVLDRSILMDYDLIARMKNPKKAV